MLGLCDDAARRRLPARLLVLSVMGLRKLARQPWNVAPKSFEERFTVKPTVAASSKWLILAQLQRDREWEREYGAARALLLAGEPAVFPAGTYWNEALRGRCCGCEGAIVGGQ